MRVCPKCKETYTERLKFCTKCGIELEPYGKPEELEKLKHEGKKEEILQSAQPKSSPHKMQWIPMVIIIGCMAIAILDQTGYINLPHFGHSNVYKISPDATVGVHCSYEFSELISFLGPESNANPAIYTFYLGSGVGFPPMGLTLGIGGVLRGIPTAKGTSKFQVCVKDVGGSSTCRTYSLTVNPASTPKKNSACPTTSDPPCHSVQNGVETSGVIVFDYCDCPSDTTYSGTTDVVTPGGPYKICVCK